MITDPPAHAPLPTRRQQIVATVLIAVACGLVYWTSLEAPFVFDDIHYIKHNVLLRDLSAPGQVVSFNPARALLLLSFAINWAISGLQTSGYHLTNVLIHMVNAFLVFRLLAELIGRAASRGPPLGRYHELAPLFGALLFAVHPLQTEAVTYIVGRSSSLATLFYLLALASFLHVHRRGRRIGWWAALLVLLYLLGLATKEIVATLPAALLLVELLLLERPGRRERLLKLHLPLWIVFWILVILRLTLLGKVGNPQASGLVAPGIYFLTQLTVIPRYLGLLFWPTGQSIDHDVRWVSSPLDPAVWLGAGLIAGLVAVALLLRRRQPLFTFGLLFFLVALAPTSTFLPIRDAMVERRMYLPVLGLAGCVGLGLALLCAWLEQVFPRRPLGSGLAVAGALALVVLSSLALTRNADYSSRLSLWAATVRESPRKSRVYNNLGLAYLEEAGDPHAAQECFEQALARDPDNAKAHNSLCVLLALRNEYEQAGQRCRRATQLDPGYADPWKNLALVEAYTGHCAQARALLAEFERRRIPPRPDPDGHQRIARCREGQVLQLDLSLFR